MKTNTNVFRSLPRCIRLKGWEDRNHIIIQDNNRTQSQLSPDDFEVITSKLPSTDNKNQVTQFQIHLGRKAEGSGPHCFLIPFSAQSAAMEIAAGADFPRGFWRQRWVNAGPSSPMLGRCRPVVGPMLDTRQNNRCRADTLSPGDRVRWPYAGLMLGLRLRRWPNIKPAEGNV